MRKLSIISFVFIILLCSSCDDWLQSSSSTRLPSDQLYETREGYQDALSGIYIGLGAKNLYGGNLTWFFLDAYSYPYQPSVQTIFAQHQKREYHNMNVQSTNNAVWSAVYSVIANINMELRQLEETGRDVIVNPEEYKLFKGELLGLRAYLHFELMKYFGSASITGESASKLTIPYVTEYSPKITPQRTNAETAILLEQDINEAIQLLYESDPILLSQEDLEEFNRVVNFDGFWDKRKNHLNYYAAMGLAVRFNIWQDKFPQAVAQAQEIIDNAFGSLVNWVDCEAIINNGDDNDWTFSVEHLFTLKVTQLKESIASLPWLMDITGFASGMCISSNLINDVLFVRNDPVTGSQAGMEDLRGPAFQLRLGALGYYSYKFYQPYSIEYLNNIPMIRISEMYYILAENAINQGDTIAALGYLNEVRRHRGISDELPYTADAELELNKEYYREFISEGVIFPYLKRKGVTTTIFEGYDFEPSDFILPYPEKEINYGRRQDI